MAIDRDELLMREYETLTPQIIHWDTLFWSKSQFFLAIQSLFLAGSAAALFEKLSQPNLLTEQAVTLLVGLVAFQLYLCFIWFRTNRSNREYLVVRFQRADEIEAEVSGGEVLKTFRRQREFLQDGTRRAHSSSRWERSMPVGFGAVWCGLLVVAISSVSVNDRRCAALAIATEILFFLLVERFGWLTPQRAIPERSGPPDAREG